VADVQEYMSALNVKGMREEALLKNFQAEEDDLTSLLDEKKQNKHMHYAKYTFAEIVADECPEDANAFKSGLKKLSGTVSELEKKTQGWSQGDKREMAEVRKAVTKALDNATAPGDVSSVLLLLGDRIKENCEEQAYQEWTEGVEKAGTLAQLHILVAVLPKLYQGPKNAKEESEEEEELPKVRSQVKKKEVPKEAKGKRKSSVDEGKSSKKSKSTNAPTEASSSGDRWRTRGHEWIGREVRRDFGTHGMVSGTITKWLTAGKNPKKDPALWHVVMDDGDEEDLEEYEVKEAFKLFKTGLNTGTDEDEGSTEDEQEDKNEEEDDDQDDDAEEEEEDADATEDEDEDEAEEETLDWLTTGHGWIGKKVRRDYGKGKGTNIGKVTKWVQAGADPAKDPAMWHVVFEDGDEEDLEEVEADEAIKGHQEFERAQRTARRRS